MKTLKLKSVTLTMIAVFILSAISSNLVTASQTGYSVNSITVNSGYVNFNNHEGGLIQQGTPNTQTVPIYTCGAGYDPYSMTFGFNDLSQGTLEYWKITTSTELNPFGYGASTVSYTVTYVDGSGTHTTSGTASESDTIIISSAYQVVSIFYSVTNGKNVHFHAVDLTLIKPSAPRSLTAQLSTQSSVLLSWTAPENPEGIAITNYAIFEGTNGAGSEGEYPIGYTGSNAVQYTVTVVPATTYYFTVKAYNGYSWGVMSNEVQYTTQNYVSSQPLSVIAEVNDDDVDLSWTAPQSNGGYAISSYTIYRSEVSGEETSLQTGVTDLSYTDANIESGHTYYYQITAINVAGESPKSTEVSILVESEAIPTAPTNVQSVYTNNGIVQISWTSVSANPSVQRYNVYRAEISGEGLFIGSTNTNAFNDLIVNQGDTYYYQVTALNSIGESEKSLETSTTALTTNTNPSTPLNLIAYYYESTGTTILSWTAPTNNGGLEIIQYLIYRGEVSGEEVIYDTIDTPENNQYIDIQVSSDVVYYYYIMAKNGYGLWSNPSNEAMTGSAPTVLPPTTEGTQYDIILDPIADPVNQIITLSWTNDSNCVNFGIYLFNDTISEFNDSLVLVGNVSANYLSADLNIADFPSGVYYFVVIAYDSNYQMSISNNETIEIANINPFTLSSTTWIYIGIGIAMIVIVLAIAGSQIDKKEYKHKKEKSRKR